LLSKCLSPPFGWVPPKLEFGWEDVFRY
jgi:hypothetical protein